MSRISWKHLVTAGVVAAVTATAVPAASAVSDPQAAAHSAPASAAAQRAAQFQVPVTGSLLQGSTEVGTVKGKILRFAERGKQLQALTRISATLTDGGKFNATRWV